MMRWCRTILVAGAAFLTLACQDILGTRPASLTGSWLALEGVDISAAFNLKQQGLILTGDFVEFDNGVVDSVAVTGLVNGRQVLLKWSLQFGTEIENHTLNGQLSRDGQTVAGTESVNGGQSLPVSIERIAQPTK